MTESTTRAMDTARTILDQIKAIDFWALASYGAENYYAISENDEYMGGVGFQVNGYHHKGWVLIKLTWVDEYEVSFIGKDRKVVKVVEGVYFPELVEVLDFVEKG